MSELEMPRIEIITIGREILDGRVIDTNSSHIADGLKTRGIVPRWAQRVDDAVERIVAALEIAHHRSDVVIVTGGLGPTRDDLSAEAFARFLGEELTLNAAALAEIESFFKNIGRPMLEVQKKQALLAQSAQPLPNVEGSAPGFWAQKSGVFFYFMPGVPREMNRMLKDHVLPRLPSLSGYRSYDWATHFTSEGELQQRLSEISKQLPPEIEITYRTRYPENHIGLYGLGFDVRYQKTFDQIQSKISLALDKDVFSQGSELKSLEEEVLTKLLGANAHLAVVESCTGGLVHDRLTNIAGASKAMAGGWLVYSNALKIALGVDANLIEKQGAVSREVATALAEAGLRRLKTIGLSGPLLCVATSGIAGPEGGSVEKPVGLCYVALAHSDRATETREVRGRKGLSRIECKNLFSQHALDIVRLALI